VILPKYILLANHWYDYFPIKTLIHLFLPFFFVVLTLEVGTYSLSQNVGNKPTYVQQS
jgi:hypothetical protein